MPNVRSLAVCMQGGDYYLSHLCLLFHPTAELAGPAGFDFSSAIRSMCSWVSRIFPVMCAPPAPSAYPRWSAERASQASFSLMSGFRRRGQTLWSRCFTLRPPENTRLGPANVPPATGCIVLAYQESEGKCPARTGLRKYLSPTR